METHFPTSKLFYLLWLDDFDVYIILLFIDVPNKQLQQ